jgi:hypothetical protein
VPRFGTPEALVRLGRHGARASSVELKASLDPPAGPTAEALTGRRAPTWSERQTYLLDTSALDLVGAGVEIRLRRRARGRYDLAVSTVRAPSAPGPPTPRGARTELDVVPGSCWVDVEIRRDVDAALAGQVVEGKTAPWTLLSREQRSWACRGGTRLVDPDRLRELRVHGPLVVSRVMLGASCAGLQRADLEHFRFPSGRELVEISTHCGVDEIAGSVSAFESLLDDQDIAVAACYRSRAAAWRAELAP